MNQRFLLRSAANFPVASRLIPLPTSSEASLALTMDSSEAVDVKIAAAAGAGDISPVRELGFMYGCDLPTWIGM